MVKLIDTPSYTIRVCWEIRFRPVCLFVRTRPSPSGSFLTQLDVFLSNYPSQLLTVISPRRLDANLLLWGTFSFHVLPGREDACFSSIPVAISALVASDVRLEVTLLGFYFYCCRPITVEIIFLPSLTHNRFALHCCLWFAFGKCSWRCCTRFSLVCFNYCQRRRTCNPTTSSLSLSLSIHIRFPSFPQYPRYPAWNFPYKYIYPPAALPNSPQAESAVDLRQLESIACHSECGVGGGNKACNIIDVDWLRNAICARGRWHVFLALIR